MEGRGLRYFVEVVRQGGFTRAAEVLNVTQPAISKMIRQLEEQLGACLLIRNRRGIRLTEAGQIAFEHGQSILEGISSLKAEIDALNGLARGTLRLGVPPIAGSLFFSPVLTKFRQRYPDISLTIIEFGGKRIFDMILTGDVDLGVTLAPFDESQFDGLVLADQELALVVSRNSRWARYPEVDLTDLADESFVMLPEEFLTTVGFRELCETAGFTPREIGHSGQWDFLATMVEAGLGITVLTTSLARALKPFQVKMVPLVPRTHRQLALVWLRSNPVSPAIRAWVEVARDVLLLPPP